MEEYSIFTNMQSILNPCNLDVPWPVSLKLPALFKPVVLPAIDVKMMKSVTKCPHSTQRHYAKNMCCKCYQKFGRERLAWACNHKDKHHYAKGLCKVCYLKEYYIQQRRNSTARAISNTD